VIRDERTIALAVPKIQRQEEMIMKKKGIQMLVLLFAVALFVFAFSPLSSQAQQKPIEITLSHIWPVSSEHHALYQEFAKRIEAGTKGGVKIVIYPSNTLAAPGEVWNAIKSGAVGIGSASPTYQKSGFEFVKAQLIFWIGAPDVEFGGKYMDKFRGKYPALTKEYSDAKILWNYTTSPRVLLTAKKPVLTVADLKGLAIRPATAIEAEMLRKAGAVTPSFMSMGDAYTGMQKGIIDGLWAPLEVLKTYRLAEVTKYVTVWKFEVGQGHYVAMNRNIWNKLPPDMQKVFEKESAWAKGEDLKIWAKTDKDAEKFAKAQGVEFINFPAKEYDKAMTEMIAPVQDTVAATWDKKGYPASKLLADIRQAIKAGK